jgi:hypothetical protein
MSDPLYLFTTVSSCYQVGTGGAITTIVTLCGLRQARSQAEATGLELASVLADYPSEQGYRSHRVEARQIVRSDLELGLAAYRDDDRMSPDEEQQLWQHGDPIMGGD